MIWLIIIQTNYQNLIIHGKKDEYFKYEQLYLFHSISCWYVRSVEIFHLPNVGQTLTVSVETVEPLGRIYHPSTQLIGEERYNLEGSDHFI